MTTENFKYFFSANLRKIRRRERLLQKELADKLGSTVKMIDAIENGRTLSLITVYKVSRQFNYSIDQLITTLI